MHRQKMSHARRKSAALACARVAVDPTPYIAVAAMTLGLLAGSPIAFGQTNGNSASPSPSPFSAEPSSPAPGLDVVSLITGMTPNELRRRNMDLNDALSPDAADALRMAERLEAARRGEVEVPTGPQRADASATRRPAPTGVAQIRYTEDFEGAPGPEWTIGQLSQMGGLSRFAGPFRNSSHTLRLQVEPGVPNTLQFDVYIIGGTMLAKNVSDIFEVMVNNEPLISEPMFNLREINRRMNGDAPSFDERIIANVVIPFTSGDEIIEISFGLKSNGEQGGEVWGLDNVIVDETTMGSGGGSAGGMKLAYDGARWGFGSSASAGGMPGGQGFGSGGGGGAGGGGGGGGSPPGFGFNDLINSPINGDPPVNDPPTNNPPTDNPPPTNPPGDNPPPTDPPGNPPPTTNPPGDDPPPPPPPNPDPPRPPDLPDDPPVPGPGAVLVFSLGGLAAARRQRRERA